MYRLQFSLHFAFTGMLKLYQVDNIEFIYCQYMCYVSIWECIKCFCTLLEAWYNLYMTAVTKQHDGCLCMEMNVSFLYSYAQACVWLLVPFMLASILQNLTISMFSFTSLVTSIRDTTTSITRVDTHRVRSQRAEVTIAVGEVSVLHWT